MAEIETFCRQCLEPFTAQRSTGLYCSNACRQRAKRIRRKQERSLNTCWICGNEIPVPAVRPQAVLTREQILRVECPRCGASPGWECDRYELKLPSWKKRPSHAGRLEDARAALFARRPVREPRRYCSKKCRADARAQHRAYRVAERASGSPSVSPERSGTVVFSLAEPPSQAAFKRLLEVVRRPGRNHVVVVVADPEAGEFDVLWKEIISVTGSALTARDEMWVARAVAGVGAEPATAEPQIAEPQPLPVEIPHQSPEAPQPDPGNVPYEAFFQIDQPVPPI